MKRFVNLQGSAGVKAFVLGFLFLVLLIPTSLITELVREREYRHSSVIAEVTSKWGGDQQMIGPLLEIPYTDRWLDSNGRARSGKKMWYLLPKSLKVRGDITTQTRKRSIYNVTLYENEVAVDGVFSTDALQESKVPKKDWLLKESRLILSISDLRGIQGPVRIRWQDQELPAKVGLSLQGLSLSAVEAKLPPLPASGQLSFSVNFRVRGSHGFFLAPVGDQTSAVLQSHWPHPSFDGAFLPETRTIGSGGFSAQWNVSHLNRQLPQGWKSDEGEPVYAQLQNSSFGVVLTEPVNHYSKTERSAKYAGLFFALTFAVFFLNEILANRLFHPLQYLMVGFALSLFYLLLLSLSEFLSFSYSYLTAAGMTTALLTVYAYGVFRDRRFVVQLALFFSGLYSFLYALLQLEDRALLAGSLLLFAALSWIMLATRKIEWYSKER